MRKVVTFRTGLPSRGPLQWGRNLIVAEGGAVAVYEYDRIEVLQWGRNLIVAEGGGGDGSVRAGGGFNGAAT